MPQNVKRLNVSAEQIERDALKVLSDSQRELLENIRENTIPERPEGFGFTVTEYMQLLGKGRASARATLIKKESKGELEKKVVYILVRESEKRQRAALYYLPGTWPEDEK